MSILFVTVLLLVLIEAVLNGLIVFLKRDFQWLITQSDLLPKIAPEKVQSFFENSYSFSLGWSRRPLSEGVERAPSGQSSFHIDSLGARKPLGRCPARIASFGDSFVFCRHVNDDETWQSEVLRTTGSLVSNYGVGNYGADQAYLRYLEQELPGETETVILGFVPETISRIQSYWKHYSEFGNFLAFKPRFRLRPGSRELELLENPLKSAQDFHSLAEWIGTVQVADRFYSERFIPNIFKFPYTYCLVRQWNRNSGIFRMLIRDLFVNTSDRPGSLRYPRAFSEVIRRNVADANALYDEIASRDLLGSLLHRFVTEARSRGHSPLIVVFPQLYDLRDPDRRYPFFFESLELPVLDLTKCFLRADYEEFFLTEEYGHHLNARGNQFVGQVLAEWLDKNAH